MGDESCGESGMWPEWEDLVVGQIWCGILDGALDSVGNSFGGVILEAWVLSG